MPTEDRISASLLQLRLSVFVVMLVWTLDKFVNPAHAAAVYANFYFIEGLGPSVLYTIGAVVLVIITGFMLGAYKYAIHRWCRAAVPCDLDLVLLQTISLALRRAQPVVFRRLADAGSLRRAVLAERSG